MESGHDMLLSRVVFDGIVASSDLCAMTTISTLRCLALRVPENVPVVGYDDISPAAHFHPALTTVRQPVDDAGKALVSLPMQQLAGERPGSLLLPTQLVQRESTRLPALVRRGTKPASQHEPAVSRNA